MFDTFSNMFKGRTPQKGPPLYREPAPVPAAASRATSGGGQTFSKIFRWWLPDGQTQPPERVEVVGSFTHWQPVPLVRDGAQDAWHATVHHIQGNRTHHYMLLVDGKPTYDKHCDGLAVPNGPQEEQFQIQTDRGPRVLMLFAQTK